MLLNITTTQRATRTAPQHTHTMETTLSRSELEAMKDGEVKALASKHALPAGLITGKQIARQKPLATTGANATKGDLIDAILAATGINAPAVAIATPPAPMPTPAPMRAPSGVPVSDGAGGWIIPAPAPVAPTVDPTELADVKTKLADADARIHTLEIGNADAKRILDALAADTTGVKARRAAIIAPPAGKHACPIRQKLAETYPAAGNPMRESLPLMLWGAAGLGKSWNVREFARLNGYGLFVEHTCSPAMDEIDTLRGTPKPDGRGGWIIPDGALVKAMRAASEGIDTMLFLDEWGRLHNSAKQFLLGWLTGVKIPQSDGTVKVVYRITTARPDATGAALEVLECDGAHLHIIGAGNLRQREDEAVWDRWMPKRIEFTKDLVITVATAMCHENGIDPETLPQTWAPIADESRAAHAAGSIAYPAGMRMLESAIKSSATAAEAMRKVADRLHDKLANWDADTGESTNEADKLIGGFKRSLDKAADALDKATTDADAPDAPDAADADADNE